MATAPSPAAPRRLDAALVTRVLALHPSCRSLNLSRNHLTCAARGDEGVLAPLRDLLQLNLSSNALRAVGPEFSVLTQLQVLDVSHNQVCVGVSYLREHRLCGHGKPSISTLSPPPPATPHPPLAHTPSPQ